MQRRAILGGWAVALAAAAVPVAWMAAGLAQRNPLGLYVDPATGAWTGKLYWVILRWWLHIAVPVSLLALACMFLNRPEDRGAD